MFRDVSCLDKHARRMLNLIRAGDMEQIRWLNERECTVAGVTFYCSLDDYSRKTDGERFILLKDREVLDNYASVFADAPPKNILEFGIFQGGSPALFSLWFNVDKFVGVDLSPPVTAFDEFCRTHPIGEKIRSYYQVSQTDRSRIEEIIRAEFGDASLDVVIDDASHLYENTRRTFEIAFPLLRPGGMYVIEDWGWAHWPGSQFFMNETPLSMLIMELVMLCASRSDLISDIRVFPSFAFIRKSREAKHMTEFNVDSSYCKRGIELVGSKNLNLRGVSGILAARLKHDVGRKAEYLTRRLNRRR